MEEGNVFDETVCMLWLLRESSCFYDLFSREEQKYLTSRINELYLNSLLAKTLLSVSIHNALDSAATWALFEKESDFFHPARYRGSISGSVYGTFQCRFH